jgi:hypothetical protein
LATKDENRVCGDRRISKRGGGRINRELTIVRGDAEKKSIDALGLKIAACACMLFAYVGLWHLRKSRGEGGRLC